MYPPDTFVMQVAHLVIEISGAGCEHSACMQGLKRIFRHHAVGSGKPADHRVVIYPRERFDMPPEATLQWASPCLGMAGNKPRRRSALACLLGRGKEVPRYSGTCDVRCYRGKSCEVDYFMPSDGEWRMAHDRKRHQTYVYSDKESERFDGLPSMLVNIIGSQYGCYLLYASCIAIEGAAWLFLGNSGVGKSTLCMELVGQGASYMGDDLVLAYRDGHQAMVGSLLLPIKCYADKGHTRKREVDVAAHNIRHTTLNAPLKAVCHLQRTAPAGCRPHLVPMPRAAMFEEMLKLTNRADTNADGRHFVDTISLLCESTPCFGLSYHDCKDLTIPLFSNQ